MTACPPNQQAVLQYDISAIISDVSHGISTSHASANNTTWNCWSEFCHSLYTDPLLIITPDLIILLQTFAIHYRRGDISPSKAPLCSCRVGGALCAIGQMLSNMLYSDPRLLPPSKLTFHLQQQLVAYAKLDPPPAKVKPIPIVVLQHTCTKLQLSNHPQSYDIANMLILSFFFLLHPREYAYVLPYHGPGHSHLPVSKIHQQKKTVSGVNSSG